MPTVIDTTGRGRSTAARLVVPLICVAQLMATLDVTIVNLALPAIDDELDYSGAHLAWVVDAYTLAYAGLLLVGGRLGDLIGRRRTLMIGVAIFATASLVAGLATDPLVLLLARAGQGAGAALATPTTLALITTLFTGAARTRAMVAYGAMAGLGITLGLVLGGLLAEHASWRWVFLVNVPIGAVLLLAAPRVIPESRGVGRRLDVAGAVLGTTALSALVFGVIRVGNEGWGEGWSMTALASSLVLLGAFVVVELRVAEPTLPLPLLRHRRRLGAYLVAALLFACLYPCFFLLSQALQQVQALGPMAAGLRFLPIGIGVLAFAVLARRFLTLVGPRALVLGGTVATTAGATALVALEADSAYVALLLPALVGLGAGVGTTFVANAAIAMTDVDDADTGIASGLLSTFQAVGGTVGVAVLASIATSATTDEIADSGVVSPQVVQDALMHGYHASFVVAAALAAAAVLVAAATAPRR